MGEVGVRSAVAESPSAASAPAMANEAAPSSPVTVTGNRTDRARAAEGAVNRPAAAGGGARARR